VTAVKEKGGTEPGPSTSIPRPSQLGARLGDVALRHRGAFEQQQSAPIGTIFHYTTGAGLKGIIESRRLWASHVESFNDSTEVLHAFGLVRKCLEEEAARNSTRATQEFVGRLRETVIPFGQYLEAYAACFYADGDLLSGWRALGSGVGGYAIGIDTSFLERRARISPGYFLVQVLYDPVVQDGLVRRLIADVLEVIREIESASGLQSAEACFPECATLLRDELTPLLASFKSRAFEEEHEWRLVHVWALGERGDQVLFRPGPKGLVPYVELKVTDPAGIFDDRVPVSRFVYGPSSNPRLTEKALALFRFEHGYDDSAELMRTRIPYGA